MSNTSTLPWPWIFSCLINNSNDSISEVAWVVRQSLDFDTVSNGYATAAVVIVIFLTALPWNLFVICAIIKKKLYSQPVIMLMLNLAIGNLICILLMPINIVSGIAGEYIFGGSDSMRCKVCQLGAMYVVLPLISLHTLALMSVDRLIYLKRPLRYSSIVTPRRMLVAIIVIWIICTVMAIPPLFGFGEIQFSYAVATCFPAVVGGTPIPNYFFGIFGLIEALVPITTLVIMHVWILHIVLSNLKHTRTLKGGSLNEDASKHSKSQLQLVKVFGAIFTANLVTWFPVIVTILAAAIHTSGSLPTLVFSIPYLFFLSETLIHPILESCLLPEIRVITFDSSHLRNCRSKLICNCRKKRQTAAMTCEA